MERLNLPAFSFRYKEEKGKINIFPFSSFRYKEEKGKMFIFDLIRRKFVVLTPEEWVRQNFLRYIADVLKYPPSLTGVEKMVLINGLKQRCDIVVYNRSGAPGMIVECKAPHVAIGNDVLDQAARYNINLRVPYLVLTNGMQHFCVHTNPGSGQARLMSGFPAFEALQVK